MNHNTPPLETERLILRKFTNFTYNLHILKMDILIQSLIQIVTELYLKLIN